MAIIRIDPDRQLGRVDRRLFGQFIEHLGRCIYGGIFDEGAPLADQHGFRTDVLDAARSWQSTVRASFSRRRVWARSTKWIPDADCGTPCSQMSTICLRST